MVQFKNPRARHPFHMHDMIRGQPEFVRETLRRLEDVDSEALLGTPRYLVVTGCGTSVHAAAIGARLLQDALGTSCVVHAIHAYDLLHGFDLPEAATVLGVSHSGATSTTNDALALARRSGAATLGMCGLPDSPMARAAGNVLVIGSVHDHSWANTMSYTTQLTAFATLAASLSEEPQDLFPRGIDRIPGQLQETLACEGRIRRLATKVATSRRVTFLGSGLDEITAWEAALKIRETCSFPASGYHAEQFLHGPFLSLGRGEAVVALRSNDDGVREGQILRSLARAGASVTTVGDSAEANVRIPSADRRLRPILSVVPLQFLAYYVALEKKANPDVMRSDSPRFRTALDPLFA